MEGNQMRMDKKTILITTLVGILSAGIIYISSNPSTTYAKIFGIFGREQNPTQLYHVYLGGKSLGLIQSKEDLERYIDKNQQKIKEKYHVENVYSPIDLDIVQEITYDKNISTTEEIYNRMKEIKGEESFTIDGYKITIDGYEKTVNEGESIVTENQVLYVLDKDIFTNSVEKTIKSFIGEKDYDNFINETQEEIETTGTIIEDMYIKNNITIQKTRIPTDGNIFTNEEDLCKYLLFGTLEEQETYTVQEGDTITDIAYNHKLAPEEFLIANTSYKTEKDLLYPGETVTLGVIQPQFDTIEETHVVSERVKLRETTYEDDDTQYTGYEKVKEEGSDGLSLVTEKVQLVNGEIVSTVNMGEVVIKEPVNKVIVRGTKKYYVSSGGGSGRYSVAVPVGMGSWVWPTSSQTINSNFGFRWRKQHNAIDIGGYRGEPIKAANNGIVVVSSRTQGNGNYIIIKHANGYFTEYAHLTQRNVQEGDIVYANDVIGTMGDTGNATGVHLHFGVWISTPYVGTAINPLTLYR